MAQISEWLRDHKLDQLLTVFEANDIDMEILFDLTDDELKELGLTLGLRKRLRSAIDSGRGAGSETVPSLLRQRQPAHNRDCNHRGNRGRRRTPTADHHVLLTLSGLPRFQSALTPGGHAGHHPQLPEFSRRIGDPSRGACRQIYGRRCALLFWLADGPRR